MEVAQSREHTLPTIYLLLIFLSQRGATPEHRSMTPNKGAPRPNMTEKLQEQPLNSY